jgi:hypothetical protein
VAVAVEQNAVAVAASTTAVAAAERAQKKKKKSFGRLSIEVLKPKIETSTDKRTHRQRN